MLTISSVCTIEEMNKNRMINYLCMKILTIVSPAALVVPLIFFPMSTLSILPLVSSGGISVLCAKEPVSKKDEHLR